PTVSLSITHLPPPGGNPTIFGVGDVLAAVDNYFSLSGRVAQFSTDGTFLRNLNDQIPNPGIATTGMAFDVSNTLYVTRFNSNLVTKVDSSGTFRGPFGSNYFYPESIVFDA